MLTRGVAFEMVCERIPQQNLVNHCLAVEYIMEALAHHLGLGDEDVARWGLAGLLHDLDYAQTSDDPDAHGLIAAKELAGQVDDEIIHAILGHADKAERTSQMDHALYCADPTTGFIVAAALVRPDKSLAEVKLKSLKKRWKEKAFARGASREQMAECTRLDLERDDFLQLSLAAMQAHSEELGL